MSSHAGTATATALPAESSSAPDAGKPLMIGLIGLAATAVGLFVSPAGAVAMSYLVGITFWTAIALGTILLIFIHHITDASWSVVIRRQWEHSLVAFKWLLVLFLPLFVASLF